MGCTDDSCDEASDSVVNTAVDANCDDGLFCDGVETCDPVLDCQEGTAPNPDDGKSCTVDSCDEANDRLLNTPDNTACDDGIFCTTDTCDPSDPSSDAVTGCFIVTKPDNDPCDDGIACVINTTCQSGQCVGTPDDTLCDDAEACTNNVCTPGVGCEFPAINEGGGCDDGVACTEIDVCTTGVCAGVPNDGLCDNGLFCDGAETCDPLNDCQGGAAPPIDDGVGCTIDSCDEVNDVVVNTTDDSLCDNGLFCDGAETCDAVLDCQAGTPFDPDDGKSCTVDSCDEVNDGPLNTPDNTACDDGIFCTTDTCDPSDPSSDAATGCFIVAKPDNDPCDDGIACVINTTCQSGQCVGTPDDTLCDDAEACTNNVCTPGVGCEFPAINEGGGCDDGVACTEIDVCTTGVCAGVPNDGLCDNGLFCDGAETCDPLNDCQGGAAPPIDDGVGCTIDSCDEVNDVVVNAVDDASCDDTFFCNGAETCDAVLDCQAGTPFDPDDGKSCTVDSCDEVNDGPLNIPDDLACDDGDSCSTDTCDPSDPSSDAATGCFAVAKPDNDPCDDGIACTVNTTCQGGQCTGTPDDTLCTDGNLCTGIETCDPLTGDPVSGCLPGTPLAPGASCADGNPCDGDETCNSFLSCIPGTPLNCDDGNLCNGNEVCTDFVGCEPDPGGPLALGVPCPDGELCNGDEQCDGAGACVLIPASEPGDCTPCGNSQLCAAGVCGGPVPVDIDEGFETGNFAEPLAGDWSNGGDTPWAAASDEVFLGRFSAKSGSILDSQVSTLSLNVNLTVPGDLAFSHREATELGFDWLIFRIDGIEVDRFSGDNPVWQPWVFSVNVGGLLAAGPHTLTWEYDKDSTISYPGDSVWIDAVSVVGIGSSACTDTEFCDLDFDDGGGGCIECPYAGTIPCDDGLECTFGDACSGLNPSTCVGGGTVSCDDGIFCNGDEICSEPLGCGQTPRVTDDGVFCTDDSCDEVNDVVVNAPNDALCDNALVCDGAETCDAVLDCQAGTPLVDGSDCDGDPEDCITETCQTGACTPVNLADCDNCADGGGQCAAGFCVLQNLDEDFESGLPFGAQLLGDGNWSVVPSPVFEGAQAAASPVLADGESATLALNVNLLQDGEVRFYHQEDSEAAIFAENYVVLNASNLRRYLLEPGVEIAATWNSDGSGQAPLWSWDDNALFACGRCEAADFVAESSDGLFWGSICDLDSGVSKIMATSGAPFCIESQLTGNRYDVTLVSFASNSGTCSDSDGGASCAATGWETSMRVKRQTTGDLLVFAVDGIVQGSWGGMTSWTEHVSPLLAGPHVLSWTFARDASLSAGANQVYLDKLVVGGIADPACDDGNLCTTNILGLAGFPAGCVSCDLDGISCQDPTTCRTGGSCLAGVCNASDLTGPCDDDNNECTVGVCAAGACDESVPAADCSPCAGGADVCLGGACGKLPPGYAILNAGNGYSFDLEPGTTITRSRGAWGGLAGNVEYFCGPCAVAAFVNPIPAVEGWNGDSICGISSRLGATVVLSDARLCARSLATGNLFDIDPVTHLSDNQGCIGDCQRSGGDTSFEFEIAGCDDGNPCTQDTPSGTVCFSCAEPDGIPCAASAECTAPTGTCAAGNCSAPPLSAGTPCSAGRFCDGAGACVDNPACVPSGPCKIVSWTGPNPGDCVESDAVDGVSCDNGLFCDGVDTCQAGACVSAGLNTADFVTCTVDSCDEVNDLIVHTPNDAVCDDGLFCSGVERCDPIGGDPVTGCIPGTPVFVDDNNPCTADSCDDINDVVVNAPLPAATPCLDTDVCNGAEACDGAGVCVAGAPLVCDDADACNGVESCDRVAGCLAGTPLSCDDGLFCNGIESCDPASGCLPGTPINIDDGIACTDDSCDEGTQSAVNTPNDANCDDEFSCNGAETCDAALDCQPGINQATGLACASYVGIMNAQNNFQVNLEPTAFIRARRSNGEGGLMGTNVEFVCGTCDVANFSGAVTAIRRNLCGHSFRTMRRIAEQDNQICARSTLTNLKFDIDTLSFRSRRPRSTSAATCYQQSGDSFCTTYGGMTALQVTPYLGFCDGAGTCANHDECDDGNPCTVDTWDGQGTPDGCHHTPVSDGTACPDDGNECTINTCLAGVCNSPVANDTPCNADSDVCTPVDSCQEGICKADPSVLDCDDVDPCTSDACDPFLGCLNQAFSCDDNKECTTDVCVDLGGGTPGCNFPPVVAGTACTTDFNDCTVDACDGAGACAHTPEAQGTSCDDADLCTTGDACNTTGDCVGSGTLACDDGFFCNGQEFCAPSLGCVGGALPDLDDGIACTVDSCDEVNDQAVHTANDALCDDGLVCNGSESCSATLGCLQGMTLADGSDCDSDPSDCIEERCGGRGLSQRSACGLQPLW